MVVSWFFRLAIAGVVMQSGCDPSGLEYGICGPGDVCLYLDNDYHGDHADSRLNIDNCAPWSWGNRLEESMNDELSFVKSRVDRCDVYIHADENYQGDHLKLVPPSVAGQNQDPNLGNNALGNGESSSHYWTNCR